MVAEETQEQGREGVRRAKLWLERSGRVDVYWTAYEHPAHLRVARPAGGERRFDLGGVIRGGDLDSRVLYAEVKKVSSAGDQGTKYEEYLANCYCKLLPDRELPCEFMWITWHPFRVSSWTQLCDAESVRAAVTSRRDDWLGPGYEVDDDLCRATAERLWLIVLSEQQERLVMSDEMLGELRKAETMGTKP